MTIKVSVKNEDSRAEAVVSVKVVDSTTMKAHSSGPAAVNLKGGESDEFTVHSGQSLVVGEVSNG